MDGKNGDGYLVKLSIVAIVILIFGLPGVFKMLYDEWGPKEQPAQVAVADSKTLSGSYSDYDEGYSDGYRDGMYDADVECSHDVNEIVSVIHEAANSYAYKYTGLDVYDAWDIIDVYLEGKDPSGHPLPTKKEFEEAIDTLMLFSMFFDLNYGDFDAIMRDYDPFYG